MPAPELSYHSGRPDALAPGEMILWEGVPAPKPQSKWLILVALFLTAVLILVFFSAIASGVRRPQARLGLGIAVTVVALVVVNKFHQAHQLNQRRYRITNRRVIIVHARNDHTRILHAEDLRSCIVVTSGRLNAIAAVGVGLTNLERLNDVSAAEAAILSLPLRSGRASRLRRSHSILLRGEPIMPTLDQSDLHDLRLQPGETPIWTGCPGPHDPRNRDWWIRRIKTLVWSLVPAGWLSACVYILIGNPTAVAMWITGFFALLWLWGAFGAVVITPIKVARRRRTTRYWLTSVRAVSRETRGGITEWNSHFLDMAGSASVTLNDDGSGTVTFAGASFENIENAGRVHGLVIEAIRAAGGSQALQVDPDGGLEID